VPHRTFLLLLLISESGCAAHEKYKAKLAWCRENAPMRCEMPKKKVRPFLWQPAFLRDDEKRLQVKQPDFEAFWKEFHQREKALAQKGELK
jgi:hypothetical protein